MIDLRPVRLDEKTLLFHLFQAYLREIARFYGEEPDSQGLFPTPYFDAYFQEPARHALFMVENSAVVGFILVNPYSFLGQRPDHVIAEFCVLPDYRKRKIAERAARLLLERFPGRWEIKYHVRNRPAAGLWTKVTAPFSPSVHPLDEEERVLVFDTRCPG